MTWFSPKNDATEQFLQEQQQQPLFYSRYTGQSAYAFSALTLLVG